jgi:hypothetical protein
MELPFRNQGRETLIPESFWNARVVPFAAGSYALSGVNVNVTRGTAGQALSLDQRAMWPHPWQTLPSYDAEEERWQVRVQPGFVNAIDPRVPILEEDGEELGLCDAEEIPLLQIERKTGKIPEFFLRLGVADEDALAAEILKIDAAGIGGVQINATALEQAKPGNRTLWSAEVYLAQARATYGIAVDTPANLVTGQIVEYTVTYNSASLNQFGSRPRLLTGNVPTKPVRTLLDIMQGNVGDDGQDYLRVATVYLLSPPEAGPELQPDGTFSAFVSHDQFWNLNYQAKNQMPANLQQSGLDPATAFFVGRYASVGATAGGVAAEVDRQLTLVRNQSDNQGAWWSV